MVGLLVIAIGFMIFLSPFLDILKMSSLYQRFLSLHSQTLKFSVQRMLPLTYDLSGFQSGVNRHLLVISDNVSIIAFHLFFYFSLNSVSSSGCSALHVLIPNLKKRKKKKKQEKKMSSRWIGPIDLKNLQLSAILQQCITWKSIHCYFAENSLKFSRFIQIHSNFRMNLNSWKSAKSIKPWRKMMLSGRRWLQQSF